MPETSNFIRSGVSREGGNRFLAAQQFNAEVPLITVITVVFNGVATIEDTIQSVLSQSYRNIEHIVIDGGSTDGTLDILKKYDESISYWLSESDDGIYDAMNKGMEKASGDVVGFLNSDDFFADASVLEQVAKAFANNEVEACYADLVYVSQDRLRAVRHWKSKQFRKGLFASGWCPPHPTFYVRKSIIEKLGGFDLSFRLAADAEFMIRYLERYGVHAQYVPRIWVKMRLGGATNRSWSNIVRQNKEIINALGKNGIHVSFLWFLANKILSRIGQFMMARIHES